MLCVLWPSSTWCLSTFSSSLHCHVATSFNVTTHISPSWTNYERCCTLLHIITCMFDPAHTNNNREHSLHCVGARTVDASSLSRQSRASAKLTLGALAADR
eukprot:m.125915 g.125915  ORF g.125915 m.125915 type:complete len:101 (+) comp22157_c0_seq3:383-685(+)